MNKIVYEAFVDELGAIQKDAAAKDVLKGVLKTRKLIKQLPKKLQGKATKKVQETYSKSPEWAQNASQKAQQLLIDIFR
jgi:hypothetical protein